MKLVVALGGHALAPPGGSSPTAPAGSSPTAPAGSSPTAPGGSSLAQQEAALAAAARAIAPLAREHALVVTHGNGPQIGWLAGLAHAARQPAPLDALGAESEGLLGYWLAQALREELPGREVAALLTQVEVDARDPAFAHPTKPIGPVLGAAEAGALRSMGHALAPDRGGLRRVVASPAPLRVLELRTIELLLEARVLVVCAGGGGIPVMRDASGRWHGAAAVVDKDRSAELLATSLAADGLLLLTDVPAVYADWPARAHPIRTIAGDALARRPFAPGTMGPKVEAACRFVRAPHRRAWIGALEDAAAIMRGEAGTAVLGADDLEASDGARGAPRLASGRGPT